MIIRSVAFHVLWWTISSMSASVGALSSVGARLLLGELTWKRRSSRFPRLGDGLGERRLHPGRRALARLQLLDARQQQGPARQPGALALAGRRPVAAQHVANVRPVPAVARTARHADEHAHRHPRHEHGRPPGAQHGPRHEPIRYRPPPFPIGHGSSSSCPEFESLLLFFVPFYSFWEM